MITQYHAILLGQEFALDHRAEIRRDPEFRAQFHQMCANIGVDPLASNKGM